MKSQQTEYALDWKKPHPAHRVWRKLLKFGNLRPPKRFAGGGYWEAMKGEMRGWFEVRIDGPKRHHYRLFCLLDYEAEGRLKPLLVIVDGRDKPFRATLSAQDYAAVRSMGEEYLSRNPRSVI